MSYETKKRTGPASSPTLSWAKIGKAAVGRVFGPGNEGASVCICALLALMVWIVFHQTLAFQFVNYDDGLNVSENPAVAEGLTFHGVGWAFTHAQQGDWVPLTTISHMVDCEIFGLKPWGHHLTNVILHGTAAILLFLVLRQMTGTLWRSGLVAALFAIHPLRAESVAWISERKDVLSGVFFMLIIWIYVLYTRKRHAAYRYYITGLLLFALGLMVKSMLVTLPFVLLLLDYWPLGRYAQTAPESASGAPPLPGHRLFWRLVIEKIPFFLLSAGACVIQLLSDPAGIASGKKLSAAVCIGNALVSYVVYIWQMFLPAGLAMLYPFSSVGSPGWKVFFAILVLGAISAGAFLSRRRFPFLFMGWLWYVGMLMPVIGLVQAGSQAHADRYTYLPQIGLCVAVVWLAAEACASLPGYRPVFCGAAATLLCFLMIACGRQTSYWCDSNTLWLRSIASTEDNALAHCNLGNALRSEGRTDEAIIQYREASQLDPNDAMIHSNLGSALAQKGLWEEAVAQQMDALRIDARSVAALNNLANALSLEGKVTEAIGRYREALLIDPDSALVHRGLGEALLDQGSAGEAIAQLHESLQLDPASPETLADLGRGLFQAGKVDESIAQYRQALRIQPDNTMFHNNLGIVLGSQPGGIAESIVEYREALRLSPGSADVRKNLSLVLFQQQSYAEALALAREAVTLQPAEMSLRNNLAWMLTTVPLPSLRDDTKALELAIEVNGATGGNNPIALRTLAAAYAGTGQFPLALLTAKTALKLAEDQSNTLIVDELRSDIKIYGTGQRH